MDRPSFRVLKIMFSNLFQGFQVSDFHCDTCEFVKHTRVSFHIGQNKNSTPFHLIHSDIWRSSTVSNISNACWFLMLIDDCPWVTWLFFRKQKFEPNLESKSKYFKLIKLEITSIKP